MLGIYLSISLLLLFSYILFLPPALTGYQILWVTWIIAPILAFSFLFNPHEADTMTTMTGWLMTLKVVFPIMNMDHQ